MEWITVFLRTCLWPWEYRIKCLYNSIHRWCYSPFLALASLIRRLHSSLFSALLLHPLIPSSIPLNNHFLFLVAKSSYICYLSEASLRFSQYKFFYGVGLHPYAQPPTWRTRVSLFVWVITFDLSGLGVPASSYATAGLALRII
jgi:hypothetical protein